MNDDDRRDLAASPSHLLTRISRALTRIGDTRLRAVGLATAQLPVLWMLRNGGQLPQSELARQAKVEQPSMAQLLARMERDGLIHREADPSDGRSSLVKLTSEAEALLPAGRAVLRQANAEITSGFSEDEVSTLLHLLGRVLANVEAMEG